MIADAEAYFTRCLYARARAYAAVDDYEKSLMDWNFAEEYRSSRNWPVDPVVTTEKESVTSRLAEVVWHRIECKGKNPLSKLDLETMTWSTITAIGDSPFPLDSHTAVVLDLDTFEWRKLKYPNQPFGMGSHTAVLYNDEMILFGGNQQRVQGGGRPASNGVHVFNFSSRTWSNPAVDDPLAPTPRLYHVAWTCKDYMLVFGGQGVFDPSKVNIDGTDSWNDNNIYAFDIINKKWIGWIQNMNGKLPNPRMLTMSSCFKDSDGIRVSHVLEKKKNNDVVAEDHDEEESQDEMILQRENCRSSPGNPEGGFTKTNVEDEDLHSPNYGKPINTPPYGDVWDVFLTKRSDGVTDSGIISCGGCGKLRTWNCDTKCQKEHWELHKVDCKKWREERKRAEE
ncbi:hypothetical protein HDU76_007754 [Blyttiomyces sp. JEL0837]|nr:hypothetical protein HDU76_007754 [Blyttiomyces sp. JEL0837]